MDLSVRAGSIRRGNLATLGPSPKDEPFYGTPEELGQSDVGSKRRHPRSCGISFGSPDKKDPAWKGPSGVGKRSGSDLLSRTVSRAVPSALEGLTSVFVMVTGGTPTNPNTEVQPARADGIAREPVR